MSELYDKKGRPIMPGDLLKIFHFVAAVRRQKKYMYKLVKEIHKTSLGAELIVIEHLSKEKDFFVKVKNNTIWEECEIIQGWDDIDFRIKIDVNDKSGALDGKIQLIEQGKL